MLDGGVAPITNRAEMRLDFVQERFTLQTIPCEWRKENVAE